MAKRAPRLQFTEEERASPELAPAIQKADKQIKKLEKAEAKVPKKEVKQRVVDSDGKITTRLSFEEKKPPSKLSHAAKVSGDTVLHGVHRKVQHTPGILYSINLLVLFVQQPTRASRARQPKSGRPSTG